MEKREAWSFISEELECSELIGNVCFTSTSDDPLEKLERSLVHRRTRGVQAAAKESNPIPSRRRVNIDSLSTKSL